MAAAVEHLDVIVIGAGLSGVDAAHHLVTECPWASFAIRACSALRARPIAWAMPSRSAASSGTTRFAASVGVDARRSATKSRIGTSGSCPIALITGV